MLVIKMKHLVLIPMLCSFSFLLVADVVPVKMHKYLFGCRLIAKSKIVNHTSSYYTIKILDIYHNQHSELAVGDLINISKEMNVTTSSETVRLESISSRKTGVAFLAKSKNGWSMVKFPILENNQTTIYFNSENSCIQGNSNQLKIQFQEYFKEFTYTSGKLKGCKTEKQVNKAPLRQLALIQYYQLYRFTPHSKILKRITCNSNDLIYIPEK